MKNRLSNRLDDLEHATGTKGRMIVICLSHDEPVPAQFDSLTDQVLVISQFSDNFVSEYRAAKMASGELPAFPLKPNPRIENAYFLANKADAPAAQAAFAASECWTPKSQGTI
jgi:hypothetical protein